MKTAIIGGTGYGALELVRLIHKHPILEIETIISNSQSGSGLSSIYPHFTNVIDQPLEELNIDQLGNSVDLVFLATPSGISKTIVPKLLDKGVKCIDLSGDFRLRSPEEYEVWYKNTSADEAYLNKATYGLSEIYPEKIKGSSLIANPGCYPTATLLGLMPVIKSRLVDLESIIIDGKSGVSGAGRSLSLATHYAEINENLKAYKLGAHQHIPEIEQVLQDESESLLNVTFTTHLVPMTRGIMCTVYASLKDDMSTNEVGDLYKEFYSNHPFVRIRPEGELPSTKDVFGSNFCDIGLHADPRTGRLTIISVIDNLLKGASGQAIQNANLINGLEVHTGLLDIPLYP
jgi:N-acetyl-gamma-glutamyl-phosphate reductase